MNKENTKEVKVLTFDYLDLEAKFNDFWHRLGKAAPKNSNRVLALAMLDDFYGVDNTRALRRVYNRIRHCRQTMYVTTNQALDLLEDSFTYTPDFSTMPLDYTIDDGEMGTLDAISTKQYELEKSASIIADKIREQELIKRLFSSMPESRYNSIKITVLSLLTFYDKELNGEKLNTDEKKAKKSMQEKIRTYLVRWYKIRPTVNYSFLVAFYESMQKYEQGLYDE